MTSFRRYDFKDAPTPFQTLTQELCQDQDVKFPPDGYTRVFRLKERDYFCRSLSRFVVVVFGLLNVFGRFCPGVANFEHAIQEAEKIYVSLDLNLSHAFLPSVVTWDGAQRKFEMLKRTSSLSQSITLPLKRTRQAITSAAIVLMVCDSVNSDKRFVDVFRGYRNVLNCLKSDTRPCSNEMLMRAFDYFCLGKFDAKMVEFEHYAKYLLENLFKGQLDPLEWRKVNPKEPQVAETKTFTVGNLQRVGLRDNVFLEIERVAESIPGSVVMAVFDTPWFVTHANFTTFCGDLGFKVLDCGNRFARCVVVATPEVFALWRKRVLIASCNFDAEIQSTHDIVAAFWGDRGTRNWLMKRLWWSSTCFSLPEDHLGDLSSGHYQAFYCLMPVLVKLDGKALAAALAVRDARTLDSKRSKEVFELFFTSSPSPKAVNTHFRALLFLKFGGLVRDTRPLYAMAMDARFDLEWRIELVRLLTESVRWPSGSTFLGDFSPVEWPLTEQHDLVSEEVARGAVSIVRCLSAKIRSIPPKSNQLGNIKTSWDWFSLPACFNTEQDLVLMTNPLVIDLAYAYESVVFQNQAVTTIPAAEKPLPASSLFPFSIERLFVENIYGEETAEKMTEKEVRERYQKSMETFRSPLLTPRTPSRPPVPFHQ